MGQDTIKITGYKNLSDAFQLVGISGSDTIHNNSGVFRLSSDEDKI
jgi:hypothetical protein